MRQARHDCVFPLLDLFHVLILLLSDVSNTLSFILLTRIDIAITVLNIASIISCTGRGPS